MNWKTGDRVVLREGDYAGRVGIVLKTYPSTEDVTAEVMVEVKIGYDVVISTSADNLKKLEMEA